MEREEGVLSKMSDDVTIEAATSVAEWSSPPRRRRSPQARRRG
ncbi:hypothetical protein QJS66_04405 [Kocuria rhizophila]|nr:hypothetical protein QJS66_04405 [Kocuria rhizophila]